jgi:hypothetical protein
LEVVERSCHIPVGHDPLGGWIIVSIELFIILSIRWIVWRLTVDCLDTTLNNFLAVLISVSPAADIEAMMEAGSPAAIAIAMAREFAIAFDFHRPDLPEPDEDDLVGAVAGGALPVHHIGASATS